MKNIEVIKLLNIYNAMKISSNSNSTHLYDIYRILKGCGNHDSITTQPINYILLGLVEKILLMAISMHDMNSMRGYF